MNENGRMKILIIHNNTQRFNKIREMINSSFKKNHILEKDDLVSAASAVLKKDVDIVVVDISNEGSIKSYYDFGLLKYANEKVPILVTSKMDDRSEAMGCITNGADNYFVFDEIPSEREFAKTVSGLTGNGNPVDYIRKYFSGDDNLSIEGAGNPALA